LTRITNTAATAALVRKLPNTVATVAASHIGRILANGSNEPQRGSVCSASSLSMAWTPFALFGLTSTERR